MKWLEHKEEIELLVEQGLYDKELQPHMVSLLEKHYNIFGKYDNNHLLGIEFKAYDSKGKLVIQVP